MSVNKDENDTWRTKITYKDWTGTLKKHTKGGFMSEEEAIVYEGKYLTTVQPHVNLNNMLFRNFVEIYYMDKRPNIRLTTQEKKRSIIDKHILPYLGKRIITEIKPLDLLRWQNTLRQMRDEEGKGYSDTYLRQIQNELNAIFNHAERYYDLEKNPAKKVEKMGKKQPNGEQEYWTLEEYKEFSHAISDKPTSYYCFQILFWTGIRSGELLGLTKEDFNYRKRTLNINKTWHSTNGGYLGKPKTDESYRTVVLPQFLADEIEDYIQSIYGIEDKDRLFPVTKSFLHHEMERGTNKSGIKKIKIHGLRHSHATLLLNNSFTEYEVADRLGHKSITITEMYSHMYNSTREKIAMKLNDMFVSDMADNER